MKNKKANGTPWVILGVIVVVLIVVIGVVFYEQSVTNQKLIDAQKNNNDNGNPSTNSGGTSNPGVNPAGTWSTLDVFSSAAVTGTSYYKPGATLDTNGSLVGDTAYGTTVLNNVNPGTSYGYWISNSTAYYVKPLVQVAGTLNNVFQNRQAWTNYTVTLTGYDTTNRQTTTSGAYNTTMAANGAANIEVSYQGVAQKSDLPFGGVFYVEMNSSITSVSCTGPGLTPGLGNFHVTYSPHTTASKTVFFNVDSTFDDGLATAASPLLQRIECSFSNGGASPGTGSPYYMGFVPANYYPGNNGNIYLDTEQYMNNGASTRTGLGGIGTLTGYWG